MKRDRKLYFLFIIITMVLGLMSRRVSFLPYVIEVYSGDVLWALMIFFIVGFIFNEKDKRMVACTALGFSYFIELSQLYHSPWIDNLRNTTLGALILGHGFLWSDILCYTIGVALGLIIENFIKRKNSASWGFKYKIFEASSNWALIICLHIRIKLKNVVVMLQLFVNVIFMYFN